MGEGTHKINRRTALKALGGTALASTVPTRVLGSEEWQCDSDCPEEVICAIGMPLNLGAPGGEGCVAAHWFGSFEYGGTWYHELSVSGAAGGYSPGGVQGQKYGVHPTCGTGNLLVTSNNADLGQHPPEDNSKLPGWGHTILDTVIGTLSVGASWFLAAGNILNDKLSHHQNGMDLGYHDIGFRYRNTNGYANSWEQCCYAHRLRWEANLESSYLKYYCGFGESQTPWPLKSTDFKQYEFNINFAGNNPPGAWMPQNDSTSTVNTVAPETAFGDPHSLTDHELAQFGIERVPDRASISKTVDGEEVTPEFVATSCPLTVNFKGAQRVKEDNDGNVISRTEIENEKNEITN